MNSSRALDVAAAADRDGGPVRVAGDAIERSGPPGIDGHRAMSHGEAQSGASRVLGGNWAGTVYFASIFTTSPIKSAGEIGRCSCFAKASAYFLSVLDLGVLPWVM